MNDTSLLTCCRAGKPVFEAVVEIRAVDRWVVVDDTAACVDRLLANEERVEEMRWVRDPAVTSLGVWYRVS
jgi:hypothetical protein